MKTKLISTAFVAQLLITGALTSYAHAEELTNDLTQPANVPLSSVGGAGLATQDYPYRAAALAPINLTFTFADSAHVANGIALRNRDSGWIPVRGVPVGGIVVKAYLYWNFSNTAAIGANSDQALFEGNRVVGAKVADNGDPCWSMAGNHTYRADVTAFMPIYRPNGDYRVMLFSSSSTSGQNPWNPSEAETIRTEGATLVVVYRSTTLTVGKVVNIYDKLTGSGFSASATFTLNNTFSGSGLFTMTGADGQRQGYTNSASNETTLFDTTQIAGPPIAASDWDGSSGWPLPQLWDVHTHQVDFNGSGNSAITYTAGADCLVPVAFVLQKGL